jgi:hypothetical protein
MSRLRTGAISSFHPGPKAIGTLEVCCLAQLNANPPGLLRRCWPPEVNYLTSATLFPTPGDTVALLKFEELRSADQFSHLQF